MGWDRLAARDRLHFGLQTMRERAEGVGGRLEIEAAPGRGTRVVATFPGGRTCPIRVLIADDHALFRRGVVSLLAAESGLVGCAGSMK